MKFDAVTIKNFRNFENITIDLTNKNVLFGMNDVGKTNFLYALNTGGFYRIGAPQIKALPIAMPDDKATVETLENLVDEVRELLKSFQEHDDKVQNVLEQIDKIIYRFYGLTDNEILCVENGQR